MGAVFPTAYFGSLSYFAALTQEGTVAIEAKEHFIKQTLRSRCQILTANGVLTLSIPVIRKNGSKTSVDAVEIAYDTNWRNDHWKAIESAYSSSPYFEHYGVDVKELLYHNESNLLKFNENITSSISSWLHLSVQCSFTEEYQSSRWEESKTITPVKPKTYLQVFGKPLDFVANLSLLDALFCIGPMTRKLLVS
jgi:hypothetical protein